MFNPFISEYAKYWENKKAASFPANDLVAFLFIIFFHRSNVLVTFYCLRSFTHLEYYYVYTVIYFKPYYVNCEAQNERISGSDLEQKIKNVQPSELTRILHIFFFNGKTLSR